MRLSFFPVVLAAVLVSSAGLKQHDVLAMGAKAGVQQAPADRHGAEHGVVNSGTSKIGTESAAPGPGDTGKGEKPPSEKKPRLKYRDPYECGC